MTEQQDTAPLASAQMLRSFRAVCGGRSFERQVAVRIREALRSEIYRRERDQYPEWIDLGGEA